MALSWPAKDPDEVLDYDVDWTQRLYSADELDQVAAGVTVTPADTIASSQFTLPSGTLVANSSSFTGVRTKVWLAGGADGQSYTRPQPHHDRRRPHHGPDHEAQGQEQVVSAGV
jgi:hypothetical protein